VAGGAGDRVVTVGMADGTPLAEAAGAADGVHEKTLERAFGRIFAVIVLAEVLQFWASGGTMSGQRPASVAVDLLLSLLLVGQAARAFRRPPAQRDLGRLAVATAVLVLADRILGAPGSPFLEQVTYVLAVPASAAWAVWSRRFVVLVPVLLMILGTGAWHLSGGLPVEQAVGALPTIMVGGVAARFMRAGARQADAQAALLAGQMADREAALAAEEAELRAANAVHDDVLSVLRVLAVTEQSLPWSLLVAKVRQAQSALAQRAGHDRRGQVELGSALHRQAAEVTSELDIRWHIDGRLEVPAAAAEALSGAAGEVLRNVTAHAGVRDATVTARAHASGGVEVTISDQGAGFDPAQVGPLSRGLRHSVLGRLRAAGGDAEIISGPGQGTTVVLSWRPAERSGPEAVDPLAWARRLAPGQRLIFLSFMLPVLLSGLALLCLRWQDMRWPAVTVAVFAGMVCVAVVCARCLSQVRMTRRAAVSLTAAVTVLAALGTLAVAPGTTDGFSFWVTGNTGIVIAAVYFLRGPVPGLTTLALDLAALTAGVLVVGGATSIGSRASILGSPVIGAGLAVGFRAAFGSLSDSTESQLADYREQWTWQARAEAIGRADQAALEYARRVAGPVLDRAASAREPDPDLGMAAALASATLRDELLAPGFLTPALAERVRVARTAGALITVDFARPGDAAFVATARDLLGAALADLGDAGDITLQVHPPAAGHPALLILHARSRLSSYLALRQRAREGGAEVSDLGDGELLVRL
jgi:Histidine kinase-, DNA gyrase B-, and HSP90-like ATPase